MRSKQSPPTPPNVHVGDLIRVHVPPLPDLWIVDEVLKDPGTWGYFLRISQHSGKVSRTIAPRGFEIVHRVDDLRTQVRAAIREITLPRSMNEGLDPRKPLPLSIPVRFDAPKGKLATEIADLKARQADARRRLERLESRS
jgi:hypothetical protein